MTKKIDGPGIAAIGAGVVFLWGGVKGYSPIKAFENILKGKNPNENQTSAALVNSGSSGGNAPAYTGPSQTYTHATLMLLWQQAGGSPASANNAACHAMQESSGKSDAQSANPDGGTNYGLWQLDTKGVGAGHTVAELLDPLTNAKITVAATNDGANWGAWATPGC
jgi:Lysozyme like domain